MEGEAARVQEEKKDLPKKVDELSKDATTLVENMRVCLAAHFQTSTKLNVKKHQKAVLLLASNAHISDVISWLAESEENYMRTLMQRNNASAASCLTFYTCFHPILHRCFELFRTIAQMFVDVKVDTENKQTMARFFEFFEIIGIFSNITDIIEQTTCHARSHRVLDNQKLTIPNLFNIISQRMTICKRKLNLVSGNANSLIAAVNNKIMRFNPDIASDQLLPLFRKPNNHGNGGNCNRLADNGYSSLMPDSDNLLELAGYDVVSIDKIVDDANDDAKNAKNAKVVKIVDGIELSKELNDVEEKKDSVKIVADHPRQFLLHTNTRRVKCPIPLGEGDQTWSWIRSIMEQGDVKITTDDDEITVSMKCSNNLRKLRGGEGHVCGREVCLTPTVFLKTVLLYTIGRKPVKPTEQEKVEYEKMYIEFLKQRVHLATSDGKSLASIGKKIVFCPKDKCVGSFGFVIEPSLNGVYNVVCSCCKTTFCTTCNVMAKHRTDGSDCTEEMKERMAAFVGLDIHACSSCRTPIERISGCDKMLCQQCNTTCCWVYKRDTLIQKSDLELITQEYKNNGINLNLGILSSYLYTHPDNDCQSIAHGGVWHSLESMLAYMEECLENLETPADIIADVISRIRLLATIRNT